MLVTLIRLVSIMHINAKVMTTNDTNYSCHRSCLIAHAKLYIYNSLTTILVLEHNIEHNR